MTKVETIRNWIACPQFGDDHYGELGALPYRERKILKDLCDYVEPLEYHDMEMTKTVIELQKRIDKAIEYIENDLQSFLYSVEYKTLLEILGGNSE